MAGSSGIVATRSVVVSRKSTVGKSIVGENTANVISLRLHEKLKHSSTGPTAQHELLQETLAIIDQSGVPLTAIANRSGVCRSALRNWQLGRTRNPLVSSMTMVLRFLGYDLALIKR